jgi:hypothetical protein
MKDRGGMATTIALLIAAILGTSYLPRKSGDTSSQGTQKPAAKVAASSSKKPPAAGVKEKIMASCEAIAKRLRRVYPPDGTVPMPAACFPDGATAQDLEPPQTYPEVFFTIAIVPNPVQTHLPLMFDRAVESIQQAAEDNNYSYDGSWFPWNQSQQSYESPSDEEQAAALEAELQEQPGIMVFRRGLIGDKVDSTLASCKTSNGAIDPNCTFLDGSEFVSHYERDLVVFLVGEQPTGGISDAQMEHALEWMQRIQPGHIAEPLRILGPTFSGTLPSLARELSVERLKPYERGARIYSGATNSDTSVHWFQLYLAKREAELRQGDWHGQLEFRTFFESDALMTDRFLCYLQHEGYDLNHVAILSEDETAFGKAVSPDSQKNAGPSGLRCQGGNSHQHQGMPVYLYYPRDIAALRSAYEEQSIFSAGKPQANAPSTSLKGDLSEPPSSEHDTVRTYGGQLTPLAQEAELFGITNVLENKQIEFVIVRSSNSLDQLFLSEFLRRSYPSGRVIIDGADVMFRRGMQGASLRGVMLLTPYPLLSWTHDAIPSIEGEKNNNYRVFAQDLSEGIYIATRELLKDVPGAEQGVAISDYAAPRMEPNPDESLPANRRPATWVTVVGHRQFWPLAVLNEHTELEDDAGPAYGPASESLLQPEPGNAGHSSGRTGLPGEMSGLVGFCVLISLWHLYCCANGSIFRPPRLRAYFAPIPRLQHTALIFIGSLLLGLLGVSLWFALAPGLPQLSLSFMTGVCLGILLILGFAFFGCVKNYRLPVVVGELNPDKQKVLDRIQQWRRWLVWAWVPALAVLAILRYFYLSYRLTIANLFPTFWRSVYLRSGVSPLLPSVLLIVGFYAWFWFNLHGLALFGDDRPVLPKVDDLPQYDVAANHDEEEHGQHTRSLKVFRMFSREGSGQNIEADALPLGKRYLKSLLVMLPIAVGVLWMALGGPSLRTLGDRRFGTLIFYAVAVCVALILADTMQLLNTWSQLRQLLNYLDRLRLRRTLATLRGLYGGSVWKLSGNVLEERYRLISRQFESIRSLQRALAAWVVSNPVEAQCKQIAIDQMTQCDKQGRAFAEWYVNLLDDDFKDPAKEYNIRTLAEFQEMLAATAGCIMKQVILPEWQTDSQSLIRSASSKDKDPDFDKLVDALPAHVRAAEEFFLLPYMGFIQNTLGRVRTIGISIVTMFVAVTVGVSCYPFDPLPVIGAVFMILFALVGAVLIFAYAEMCRDATLSRIADTNPGELGWGFWGKMVALGAGPLLGLLTTLFPSMTDFIVSFLQPGAEAMK